MSQAKTAISPQSFSKRNWPRQCQVRCKLPARSFASHFRAGTWARHRHKQVLFESLNKNCGTSCYAREDLGLYGRIHNNRDEKPVQHLVGVPSSRHTTGTKLRRVTAGPASEVIRIWKESSVYLRYLRMPDASPQSSDSLRPIPFPKPYKTRANFSLLDY